MFPLISMVYISAEIELSLTCILSLDFKSSFKQSLLPFFKCFCKGALINIKNYWTNFQPWTRITDWQYNNLENFALLSNTNMLTHFGMLYHRLDRLRELFIFIPFITEWVCSYVTSCWGSSIYIWLSIHSWNGAIDRFGATNNIFVTKKLPRRAPFAGGMKFATQISPLLNFLYIFSK